MKRKSIWYQFFYTIPEKKGFYYITILQRKNSLNVEVLASQKNVTKTLKLG